MILIFLCECVIARTSNAGILKSLIRLIFTAKCGILRSNTKYPILPIPETLVDFVVPKTYQRGLKLTLDVKLCEAMATSTYRSP